MTTTAWTKEAAREIGTNEPPQGPRPPRPQPVTSSQIALAFDDAIAARKERNPSFVPRQEHLQIPYTADGEELRQTLTVASKTSTKAVLTPEQAALILSLLDW